KRNGGVRLMTANLSLLTTALLTGRVGFVEIVHVGVGERARVDDDPVTEADFFAGLQSHRAIRFFLVREGVAAEDVDSEEPVASRVPVGGMARVFGVIENRDSDFLA